jgi:predicted DNA-binding transcriptional regulator AlpA
MSHLALDDASELQAKQFDAAPEALRGGWTSSRVIKTWEKWSYARDAAAGERSRPTARQRALRRALGAEELRTDDHIETIRSWLTANPPKLNIRHYREWASEHNAARAEGELRAADYMTIQNSLGIGWDDTIRVARGEVTLDEARKQHVEKRNPSVRPEHALVTTGDIVAMWGRDKQAVAYSSNQEGFPAPVVIVNDRRLWLRSDIEAYIEGEPVPEREPNELGHLYVTAGEAKKILGLTSSVAQLSGCPAPKYSGSHFLWLRSEIEAWRDERVRGGAGRGKWKRPPKA